MVPFRDGETNPTNALEQTGFNRYGVALEANCSSAVRFSVLGPQRPIFISTATTLEIDEGLAVIRRQPESPLRGQTLKITTRRAPADRRSPRKSVSPRRLDLGVRSPDLAALKQAIGAYPHPVDIEFCS